MENDLEQVQKQAKQLKLLNELSTSMQSLLESDRFYQEIVELIQTTFHYYSIQIWSIEPGNQDATLEAQAGAYSAHLKIGHKILPGQGIVGAVALSHKSYLANDCSTDLNFTNLSLPIESQAELCVPVLRDGRCTAVLSIESKQKDSFHEDELITLEAVAAQVAVALANRSLYREATLFSRKLQKAVEEKTIELRRAHERILEQQRLLQKENKVLKTRVEQAAPRMDLVGKSPAFIQILSMVDKVAPTTATVLLLGESGTGKELIARRIHERSARASGPYVTVNCGTLQESLLESELFGHEKGSFTGATQQKIGLCEVADGGTLFLDEIGEMSAVVQAKLLRFLQEGEFYRIGGKHPIRVSVRVISATNRDLEKEVQRGAFREDLFYRLNTITLKLPPLRKRKDDIPLLVEHFLRSSSSGQFGPSKNRPIEKISPEVLDAFLHYQWPGNIRELQNTIERLLILSENGEIKADDIPSSIRMSQLKSPELTPVEFATNTPLEDVEKNHILKTLELNQGNKTKTAQHLGITIKTLYNKLHRYGLLQKQSASDQDYQH